MMFPTPDWANVVPQPASFAIFSDDAVFADIHISGLNRFFATRDGGRIIRVNQSQPLLAGAHLVGAVAGQATEGIGNPFQHKIPVGR